MAHACVSLSEIELYFPQVCARACVHLYVANASAAMSMLFGCQRVMSMLSGSLKHLKRQLFFLAQGYMFQGVGVRLHSLPLASSVYR